MIGLFFFFIASVQDLKEGYISNWICLIPGALSFFSMTFPRFFIGILSTVVGFQAYNMGFWNKADSLLMFSAGFWYGHFQLNFICVFLAVSVVYVFGYRWITKAERIRYAPVFLLTGLILVLFF